MIGKHTFHAIIEEAESGGAYVCIPFDVEKAFGKKRVPIRATIDGEEYRGKVVRMGGPGYILGVLKEIRSKIGKDIGDEVEVVLEEDRQERVVVVPEDLKRALEEDTQAKAACDRLSYTNQKEIARSIEEVRKAETRQGRIAKAIDRLRNSR